MAVGKSDIVESPRWFADITPRISLRIPLLSMILKLLVPDGRSLLRLDQLCGGDYPTDVTERPIYHMASCRLHADLRHSFTALLLSVLRQEQTT